MTMNYREYTISATEIILGETISYTLPASASRNTCNDAIYDMFCMPVSPKAFGLQVDDTNLVVVRPTNDDPEYIFIDVNSEYQLAMAAQVATKLGAGTTAGNIYDLQLLPYCPMINELAPYYENTYYGPTYGKNVINVENLTNRDYTIIRNGDSVACGIVFYPKKANFATSVDISIPNETVHEEWLAIEKPTLLAQGRTNGLTRWTIHEGFPYGITEGP